MTQIPFALIGCTTEWIALAPDLTVHVSGGRITHVRCARGDQFSATERAEDWAEHGLLLTPLDESPGPNVEAYACTLMLPTREDAEKATAVGREHVDGLVTQGVGDLMGPFRGTWRDFLMHWNTPFDEPNASVEALHRTLARIAHRGAVARWNEVRASGKRVLRNLDAAITDLEREQAVLVDAASSDLEILAARLARVVEGFRARYSR